MSEKLESIKQLYKDMKSSYDPWTGRATAMDLVNHVPWLIDQIEKGSDGKTHQTPSNAAAVLKAGLLQISQIGDETIKGICEQILKEVEKK